MERKSNREESFQKAAGDKPGNGNGNHDVTNKRLGTEDSNLPSSSSLFPSNDQQQGEIDLENSTAKIEEMNKGNEVIPFDQVKKELEILNTEGCTRLYTGPYGRIQSPFKKFSSFRGSQRGVKRSPRKLPIPRSKKAKLLSNFDLLADDSSSGSDSDSSTSEAETPEKLVDNNPIVAGPSNKPQPFPEVTDDESEDSDSEEDKWQIMEESETEFDKQLESKSDKFSLSAINVKSIIHKIVTNEKVVEMVRKAVLEQVEEKRLEYEPKMTRSKAKEVMETQGDIPHPLGLSPMKKMSHDESKFLDIDLPEDEEDDEDFNPDKVEDIQVSEDDSESFISSGLSDCETYSLPSTPTTPKCQEAYNIKESKTPTNPDTENSNSFLSPMGPPLQSFVPRSHHKSSGLGQKFRDAIEKDERAKREEEELIASRTRSKCPLNEVSMLDIEANFVAPDITEDMYDTTCNDQDWNHFLKTLIVFDSNTTEDTNEAGGEDEDPEFNFLEESEQDEYDQEDFRNDRAVKVSKKELNLLIDELYEAYNESDPIDINSKNMIRARTETIVEANNTKRKSEIPESLIMEVGENERRQISDQMRQHVQLLAQSFVLGMGDPEEHQNVIDAAKMFLNELKDFSERMEKMYPDTLYKICSLPAAMSLMNDSIWTDKVELSQDETERLNKLTFKYENQKVPTLNYKQMKALWSNPVFMYPELLPHGGFYKLNELKKDRSRVKFIEAEDNLLAMGMDQFSHLHNSKDYIHSFMLPCKTKKQIQIRIKNLSAKTAKSNAVKYWKEHKSLPVFPQAAPFFNPSLMKASQDRNISLLEYPSWAVFFRPQDAGELTMDGGDSKPRRKQRSISFTADKSMLSMSGDSPTGPATPVQHTDSSNLMSSSSSGNSTNSRVELNRTKNLTRKKLDLDQGRTHTVPAFIPLTFSGTIKSASSGLTVTSHMDKSPIPNITGFASIGNTPVGSSVISVADITASTVSSISSLPPLILLHNKEIIKSESSNVGLSPTQGIAGTGIISKDGKIFVMTGQSVNVNNSALGSNSCVNITSLNVDNVNNNMGSDVSHVQTQQNTNYSSINSSVESKPVLTSTKSSISASSMTMANANNNALQTASHSSPVCKRSPASHCPEQAYTPDRSSNSSTPTRSIVTSPGSEGGRTPKNALEIIASYAPYLLSPSAKRNQQKLLETTPKKKSGFIKLAPKPTPPGFNPSPVVPIHVPKVKSSPRRQRLNEQAKAILPKGFVIRSFDVSPSKKAASSLIEKAKKPCRKGKSQSFYFSSSSGYCKILPHPDSISENNAQPWGSTESDKQIEFHTGVTSTKNSDTNSKAAANNPDNNKDSEESYVKDRSESEVIDMDIDDDEDKGVDTESDYTQSEDGNETQEDVDSQEEIDSQEDDDNHIANLMQASTTTRFDPSKDDSCKHLGKKDRDRDTTLAMLAPDVITSDPQRDMRDTAYAQAYLHKVKKVLRDDMDILEQFLHLMFNFSKAKESPVKLYMELRSLFKDYPGLIHDFAGFLLQEQAVECDCYGAFEEFNLARSFLRKLELYFSKTPHHFQRIIKTFSRWYRKPGRSSKDLKNEIEPMLKSHKYLLEEFSKFFPEDQPPESLLDDFEEINMEGSDEEINNDSFEEIELFEGEEVLGTKRCTCTCHEWRDETFRKKKKHCYRCCLTVIDGELVYRVNKSTIKKISITLGPPFKASSLLGIDTDDHHTIDINHDTGMKSIEINTEVENHPGRGEELMQVDSEPADLDSGCVVDSDGLERETSTDGNVARIQDGQNVKSAGWAKTNRMIENVKELDSVVTNVGEEKETQSDAVCKQIQTEVQDKFGKHLDETTASSILSVVPTNQHTAFSRVQKSDNLLVSENIKSSTISVSAVDPEVSGYVTGTINTVNDGLSNISEKFGDKSESEHSIQRNASDISNASSQTALANDILAAAFNAALMSEVSLDAAFQFPLATQYSQSKQAKVPSTSSLEGQMDQRSGNSFSSVKCDEMYNTKGSPNKVKDTTNTQPSQVHPSGQGILHVSTNSSFTKVVVAPTNEETSSKSDQNILTAAVDLVQPFSPFSPFGLEIQSITSAKSPSPCPAPTVSKHRRITPIPVKGSSGDDQSFQNVVQNSPVITDMIQSPFGLLVVEKSNGASNSSSIGKVPTEGSHLLEAMPFADFGSYSTKSAVSTSHKSGDTEICSQKSDVTEKSSTSDNTVENPTSSALIISQPALFSEDANVAFTRTSELTNMTANISEESLLQCLERPSHFCDTMGTVSNLTNILNALDEKSIQFKSLEKKVTTEKHDFVDTLKNINSISFPLNAVKQAHPDTVIESDTLTAVAKSSISDQDNKTLTTGPMSVGSDSSDSGKKSGKYYPQSIQSIENLDRINTGMFRVSSLSDSESSGTPTPSNSLTQVQVVTHNDFKQPSQTRTIEVHSKQTLSDFGSINVSMNTEGEGVGSSKLSNSPENIQPKHQHKASTHESETGVERCEKFSVGGVPVENSNTVCEAMEKHLSDQNEIITGEPMFREGVTTCSTTAQKDNTSEVDTYTAGVEISQVKILEDESLNHEKTKKKKKKKREHGDIDSSKKKKKKRTKERKLDEMMVVSPDASSQDSVSGTEQSSSVQLKDLRSSPAILVEETDKFSGSECSPVDSISAQSLGMMQSGPSPSQGSIQSPTQSSCSSSGGIDDEINWTKETDRIILEKCKAHGIKEKTFVKIAKQLGDVTYKQVKRRFNHLYQLIFGAQFKTEGGQETSSS